MQFQHVKMSAPLDRSTHRRIRETQPMTPSGQPEFRPSDETNQADAPAPTPHPLQPSESDLDWLENQKRSRWSKFILDFAIIAITLLISAILIWAAVRLWKH